MKIGTVFNGAAIALSVTPYKYNPTSGSVLAFDPENSIHPFVIWDYETFNDEVVPFSGKYFRTIEHAVAVWEPNA